jgi:hypothetical protein
MNASWSRRVSQTASGPMIEPNRTTKPASVDRCVATAVVRTCTSTLPATVAWIVLLAVRLAPQCGPVAACWSSLAPRVAKSARAARTADGLVAGCCSPRPSVDGHIRRGPGQRDHLQLITRVLSRPLDPPRSGIPVLSGPSDCAKPCSRRIWWAREELNLRSLPCQQTTGEPLCGTPLSQVTLDRRG